MIRALRVGIAVVATCSVVFAARRTNEAPAADGLPSGMVSFFTNEGGTGCPPGWTAATAAQGRLVVGVTEPAAVGVRVGMPLADQEDRAHAHPFAAMVTLAARPISAADGSNDSGAAAQDYAVTGTTDAATSGLPFVQLVVCEKP